MSILSCGDAVTAFIPVVGVARRDVAAAGPAARWRSPDARSALPVALARRAAVTSHEGSADAWRPPAPIAYIVAACCKPAVTDKLGAEEIAIELGVAYVPSELRRSVAPRYDVEPAQVLQPIAGAAMGNWSWSSCPGG